ncbi:hypothetical protein D3C81_1808000 [compost metagenome]
MPLRMVHRQTTGQRFATAFKFLAQRQCFRLHTLLNLFTRLVERIQFIGKLPRFTDIVTEQ